MTWMSLPLVVKLEKPSSFLRFSVSGFAGPALTSPTPLIFPTPSDYPS